MSEPMTSHERYLRVLRHQEPDRVPMRDVFWESTTERWRHEGLPLGVDPAEYFGFDRVAGFGTDNSPRFPVRVIEDTDAYTLYTTQWGVTQRNWKHRASVPEFLEFQVVDRDSWAAAKGRMTPSRDRVNWANLERNWSSWTAQGHWITAGAWFGFDVLHSWFVGTERVMMAIVEDPQWVKDMIDTMLELDIALLSMVWDGGYHFDCVQWPDDLGYVNGPLISPRSYREVIKPAHKRMCDWCHDRGVFAWLHSCGGVMPLVPDLIEAGIDALQPLEQKAGMDVFTLKREFGNDLVLEGGIDVRKMTRPAEIEEEIRTKFAVLKQGGGYCYHSDHSVPDDVSFQDYCRVIELVKEHGRY